MQIEHLEISVFLYLRYRSNHNLTEFEMIKYEKVRTTSVKQLSI